MSPDDAARRVTVCIMAAILSGCDQIVTQMAKSTGAQRARTWSTEEIVSKSMELMDEVDRRPAI